MAAGQVRLLRGVITFCGTSTDELQRDMERAIDAYRYVIHSIASTMPTTLLDLVGLSLKREKRDVGSAILSLCHPLFD